MALQNSTNIVYISLNKTLYWLANKLEFQDQVFELPLLLPLFDLLCIHEILAAFWLHCIDGYLTKQNKMLPRIKTTLFSREEIETAR